MSNSLPNRYFPKIDVGCPWNSRKFLFLRVSILLLFAILFQGLKFSNKLLHLFKSCFPYVCAWHTVEMKPSSQIYSNLDQGFWHCFADVVYGCSFVYGAGYWYDTFGIGNNNIYILVLQISRLCSSRAWWPLVPTFCSCETRKYSFFNTMICWAP